MVVLVIEVDVGVEMVDSVKMVLVEVLMVEVILVMVVGTGIGGGDRGVGQ